MATTIKPTVGRKVWYFPSAAHHQAFNNGDYQAQPFDATVIFVENDRCVNLRVTSPMGDTEPVIGAYLQQPGDDFPNGPHAAWMPYQQTQAKKESESVTAAAKEAFAEFTAGLEGAETDPVQQPAIDSTATKL